MKILAIGDVVGSKGVEHLKNNLWNKRRELCADFVVVNGENAADIYGMGAADAKALLEAGADLITHSAKRMYFPCSPTRKISSVPRTTPCLPRAADIR